MARTLHTLGECLIKMNDFNEAKTCLEQAMQIKQISSNDTSSERSLAVILYTLGECLMNMNELTEAKKCLQIALDIKQRLSNDIDTDINVAVLCIHLVNV